MAPGLIPVEQLSSAARLFSQNDVSFIQEDTKHAHTMYCLYHTQNTHTTFTQNIHARIKHTHTRTHALSDVNGSTHRLLAHDGLLHLHDLCDLVHARPELLALDALIDTSQQVWIQVVTIINTCHIHIHKELFMDLSAQSAIHKK